MAGQPCPFCAKPIEPGEHVAFQHGILMHLHCYALERLAKKSDTPRVRCALCHEAVQAGANAVFGADGRVAHKICPTSTPDDRARPISGGAHDSTWTQVFDRGLVRRAARDPRAFAEAAATVREVCEHARAVRTLARQACAR
jgi:hypothetical protein